MLAGCATQFYGDAHITPDACAAKCSAARMEVGGMVYLGEYSSACVCQVPRAAPATTAPAVGAVAAPAVGVVLRMREQAAAAAAAPTASAVP